MGEPPVTFESVLYLVVAILVMGLTSVALEWIWNKLTWAWDCMVDRLTQYSIYDRNKE